MGSLTPDYYSLCLKGIIIVHEIIINSKDFQHEIFFIYDLKINSSFRRIAKIVHAVSCQSLE